MYDKQLILNLYIFVVKDEWLLPQELEGLNQLLLDSGIGEDELENAMNSLGKMPHIPDQLWQKEVY